MSLTGGQVDAQNHIGRKSCSGESSFTRAGLVSGTAVVILEIAFNLLRGFEVDQRNCTVEFALNNNKLRI